jgi:malate dehydrogenase
MLNTTRQVMNVCVSGAAGNIAHSFYNSLGSGEVFGNNVEFNLRLLELPEKMNDLKVLGMELEDCCFQLVRKMSIHCNPDEAFEDLDFAILMGGASRKPGMERKDLFDCNRRVFEEQGKSLNTYAKKTCKILVVANPANTNCLIVANNAPSIPKSNFSCLTRLDYNRAVSQVAIKSGSCNN